MFVLLNPLINLYLLFQNMDNVTLISELRHVTKQSLTENVSLFITRIDTPLSYTYELECDAYKVLHFELDFSGSRNIKDEHSNKTNLLVKKSVLPFSKEFIVKVVLLDDSKQGLLKTSKKWTIDDPQFESRSEYIEKCEFEIQRQLIQVTRLGLDSLRFVEIGKRCEDMELLYMDSTFPPVESSLFASVLSVASADRPKVCWRRPR